MNKKYWRGAEEEAIEAARKEVVGQILEFLLASPGEQALRRILGIIDSPSSLSGRTYENLYRPPFFSPILGDWRRGFCLNAPGRDLNLPPEMSEMFFGAAFSPAEGKDLGGDVVVIRPVDSSSKNASLAFCVADCITPVFPMPSELAAIKEEIEDRYYWKTGNRLRIGADELLALLLHTLPISDYLEGEEPLVRINSALYERLASIGCPPTAENFHLFPGAVMITGKIEGGYIALQGTGDVRVALVGRDGTYILSPDSFVQGGEVDRTTVAIMEFICREEGVSWWDCRKHPMVEEWLQWTYRNKFGKVVTVVNGLPGVSSWKLEYPLASLSAAAVYTDGLLYCVPPNKRDEKMELFFESVFKLALVHQIGYLRASMPRDSARDSSLKREKKSDDLAGMFLFLDRPAFVEEGLRSLFGAEPAKEILSLRETVR